MTSSLLSQEIERSLRRSHTGPIEEGEASSGNDSDTGAMTCSICLQHPALEQIASLKGCDHAYCVKCILRWAAHRDKPTCPQCKLPFETVMTYQQLDGTLCDFPCEESVVLLKRAHWFTEHLQEVDRGGTWRVSADDGASGFADYEPYYREFDDDEEVEDYYFSAAAGRARIVLGNRRHGENGFISSGRRQARPAQQASNSGRKKKGGIGSLNPKPTSAPPAKSPAAATPKPSRSQRSTQPQCASGSAVTTSAQSSAPSDDASVVRRGPPQRDSQGPGTVLGDLRDSSASKESTVRDGSRGLPASAKTSVGQSDGSLTGNSQGASEACGAAPASRRVAASQSERSSVAYGGSCGAGASCTSWEDENEGSGRVIPPRSNRRRGGVPKSSSYRPPPQQQSAIATCPYGQESGDEVLGSSPLGSSPGGGSSRGSGRRAKRNLRRTLDDELALLHT